MRLFISAVTRLSCAAVVLIIFSLNNSADAQRTVLRVSHFMPGTYFLETKFLGPWAKELERRTRGRIKVEIYNKNSRFGKVTRQADQVREGVIDIALGHSGFPKGRLKRTSIIEMPFLVNDAGSGSMTLWQLYKEGLISADYKGFKVLGLYVHQPGEFHTAIRPVLELEDLTDLRMRTSSQAVSAMLRYLRAQPKGMSPARIYENLDRAAIDGLVTGWPLIGAANLNDLIKYHTDAKAYTTAFFVVMNEAKYNSLPADIRRVIDDISGDALAPKFGPWFDDAERPVIADARARGNTIIPVSEEKRNRWRNQLKPMIDDYLGKLEKQGVPNARQIYERAQQLITYYERQLKLGSVQNTGPRGTTVFARQTR